MKGKESKLWAMHASRGEKLVSLEDLVRSASKISFQGACRCDGTESPSGSAVAAGEDDHCMQEWI
jgi:hypothetical protein